MNEKIIKLSESLETKLLSMRNSKGVWTGELSSSALSTATAIYALHCFDNNLFKRHIDSGLLWLKENINDDGGYGDTIKSESNLSTTLLCWSALSIVKGNDDYNDLITKIENKIIQYTKTLNPESISKTILDHYQKDLTFSVPILAFCALAGRLGKNGWKYVPQLPFQLAIFPNFLFKWMNLNVVSYAIPALISMGLAKHKLDTTKNPLLRFINWLVIPKVLRVLKHKQPENGGFLEATPLTSFVTMTLIAAGYKDLSVCKNAVQFITKSIRPDGSWPIDTNLSTWVSSLSINALRQNTIDNLCYSERASIKKWYTDQQFKTIHPFTHSKAGGWGWTDLPGSAPDADDTSGALIALNKLYNGEDKILESAQRGIKWLISVQNKDGGIPTFCKGWGKLPFDCSCPDITAHALRAMLLWKKHSDKKIANSVDKSVRKMVKYFSNTQRPNGNWVPLWFGNEDDIKKENPVYGTSLVLYGLKFASQNGTDDLNEMIDKGYNFLIKSQNSDGGWGGNAGINSSVEETSLAVKAINSVSYNINVENGIKWLENNIENNIENIQSKPIGLYFASLWYFEQLYPYTFACSALNEVVGR